MSDENYTYPVAELLRNRRTIRQFKSDFVPLELLLELLNIANWAPNHGLREPWRFILYRKEARATFADAVIRSMSAEDRARLEAQKRDDYAKIPYHLIVVMKEDPRQKQWDEDYGAACSWIQSFQLAAWERGLGVVWKTNNFVYSPHFREAVGVQAGEKVVGVLHIGYPEVIPEPRPRTPAEERLTLHG
ncbi:nitroreductase family protein [Cohnella cholangitidis]|uniref:Putative NAD(P)H nitroreductase n=1 Tax=Cohnella cholangitidis TaxID=2598458 RepID=A0A7G5C2G8_9BACL|nr:nitroreductase [Cohnella cholangitidis]QMV43402.1 nitroreductase [Cohnella cholangitidis]